MAYSADEARDSSGKWTSGGAGGGHGPSRMAPKAGSNTQTPKRKYGGVEAGNHAKGSYVMLPKGTKFNSRKQFLQTSANGKHTLIVDKKTGKSVQKLRNA